MGNHQDRRPALARDLHRLDQRGLPFRVEEGIGLVQHENRRIAVKRPRQRDPLRLAGRQACPERPEPGVIALRQLQDQLVHPGELGRLMASASISSALSADHREIAKYCP